MLARLIQGVAAGGEVGASMSLLVESAPANRRGFTAVGHWRLKAWQQLWRCCRFRFKRMATVRHRFRNRNGRMGLACAVFIGVLLAPIGCWLRLSLENDVPEPVRNKSCYQRKRVFCSCNIRRLSLMAFYSLLVARSQPISPLYYGTWAAKYLAMPQHYSHAAMLLAGVVTFVGALLVGMLCDSVGRKS